MKIKKYLATLIAFSLLLAIPAVAGAQSEEYSDVLTDEEGDVTHIHGTGWRYNVERPNIDIIRAELSESDDIITVSLTVKGTITDEASTHYYIYLEDGESGFYYFYYIEDNATVWASNEHGWSMYDEEVSGVGTNTLSISTSIDDLLNPASLRFSMIYTYDYIEGEDDYEYYWDTASPDDSTDPGEGFVPIDHRLSVQPNLGPAPLEVWIEVEAENIGEEDGEIPVTIDGEVIGVLELGAYDFDWDEFSYTFYEPGTYIVMFGDETVTVTVTDETDEPDTPYSDLITDPEGDVMRLIGPGDDDWEFVDSPDTDILRVEITEGEGIVTVSLTLKGIVRDHPDIYYEIDLRDASWDGEFDIWYNNGDCEMSAYIWRGTGGFANNFQPSTSGLGTDTLSISFTRDQIGNPSELLISSVFVYNEGLMEVDFAGPDAPIFPPGYDDDRFIPINYDMMVDYDAGQFPLEVTIYLISENAGDLSGVIPVYIDGSVVYNFEVGATGESYGEYTHTFYEPGEYTISFEEMEYTVVVEEGDDTFDDVTYELTLQTVGEGSTDLEEGTHTYEAGEEVIITATPADGWYFDRWTGDVEDSSREITVTMDSDKTIIANFAELGEENFVLTIKVEGEGSTDPEAGDHIFEAGDEVIILATPGEGWVFDKWTGDISNESTSVEITITMDENKEVTVHFAEEETDDDEDDTPGFTLILLVMSLLLALIIYRKSSTSRDASKQKSENTEEVNRRINE